MTVVDVLGPQARGGLPPAAALGRAEAVRLLRHPALLAGGGWLVVMAAFVANEGPRDAVDVVTTLPTFCYGVLAYFGANRLATRERRSDTGELLAPLPRGAHERTWALVLGAFGPALATALFVAVAAELLLAAASFADPPSVAMVAQAPLTVLGGALLGVLVGRWVPYVGAPLVVMVAMVGWDVVASNRPETVGPLGTYTPWARWVDSPRSWAGFYGGSPGWHVVYLAALCAMAAVGALLRTAPHRGRLLAVGAAATAVMLAAAVQQLP